MDKSMVRVGTDGARLLGFFTVMMLFTLNGVDGYDLCDGLTKWAYTVLAEGK